MRGLVSNKTDKNMYLKLSENIKKAKKIYFNVSFIRDSGLKLIINTLLKANEEGKEIKIITSDYMNITEPNALYRLLDLKNIKIYKNKSISFHPKAYIFQYENGDGEAYIGSSNISYSALTTGLEWNYKFQKNKNQEDFQHILEEFDDLYMNETIPLDLPWLRNYQKRYRKNKQYQEEKIKEKKIEPIKFQIPALYELNKTREEGYKKAMVVVGTGLGKTYLSAFDSLNFKRVLFVAHREEILQQTKISYEKVHENKTYGFFTGEKKEKDKDIIFASVMTLGKEEYLNETYFPKDYFDYIVVDEFHHSEASTYQRVLNYFEPKFLLGLTATPDRMDNADVYKFCDYNIAYECDFKMGINNGWLVPFDYYGIYDEIDYDKIPWRNGKYDLKALEDNLLIENRAKEILKKYINLSQNKTVAFCVSVRHANYMSEFFRKNKIKSEMIVGETPKKERKAILKDFKEDKLDILFVVDIFNEGVDIPSLDTVLFLRPTNSSTIFLQQLGRGLRTSEGKKKLRVLDFVGNYKGANLKPRLLVDEFKVEESHLRYRIDLINEYLPENCIVNMDLKLLDYFKEVEERGKPLKIKLKEKYLKIKEKLGRNPNIMDIYTMSEINPSAFIREFKSWLKALRYFESLDENQSNYNEILEIYLSMLERTSMTKSYKMSILLSFVKKEKLIKEVSMKELIINFKKFYEDKLHRIDLSNSSNKDLHLWKDKKIESFLLRNPIKALLKTSSNIFDYKDEILSIKDEIFEEINNKEIVEESFDRIEFRTKNYFSRKYSI